MEVDAHLKTMSSMKPQRLASARIQRLSRGLLDFSDNNKT